MKIYTSKKSGQTLVQAFFTLMIIFFLICMISNPSRFIEKSLDGISAWAFNVLPSVLPFMFFTRVLSQLDLMPKILKPLAPISKTFFKTPPISIYTFIMAILSGYPVGSKMVADLYMQGKITKQDAFKMTSFCSTSGPMFIVGAVGIGMFKSSKIGYILFLSHFLGAIINGIIFRNFKFKKSQENQKQSPAQSSQNIAPPKSNFDLSSIVLDSTLAILSVGSIITIFFIIIECFSPIISLMPQTTSCLFEGVLEITKGCLDLATLQNKFLAITLASFVISFGGVSTILQSLTMLSKLQMPTKLFVLQKFLHAVFSCIVTIIILLIFGF